MITIYTDFAEVCEDYGINEEVLTPKQREQIEDYVRSYNKGQLVEESILYSIIDAQR